MKPSSRFLSQIQDWGGFFFHPLNIVELGKKNNGVCSGGKLRKSSQVLYRSDQEKYFLKINQNYFAHIFPEYGFRVKSVTNIHTRT